MAAMTCRGWMALSPVELRHPLEAIQERWFENGDRMLDESDLYTRPPGPDALPG